jgi:hypothetical protein
LKIFNDQLKIFNDHFLVIWYIFPGFGILDQEKSGNPDPEAKNTQHSFHGKGSTLIR